MEEITHCGLFALLVLYLTVNSLLPTQKVLQLGPAFQNLTTVMTKRYGCGSKFRLIGMNGHEYRGNLDFLLISLHFSFSKVE